MFKSVSIIIAALLILSGLVWVFQGVGILPGSYMSGDPKWAVNGGIAVAAGLGLLRFAARKSG